MELFPASQIAERLERNDRFLEMILERNNKILAWKQVCANDGAPGVDGMTTAQLGSYLGKHWPKIEQDLLNCRHHPMPVKSRISAVTRPWIGKFSGFTYFQMCGQSKIRIHAKSIKRFKDKVRELTCRKRGRSLWQVI